MNRSIKLFLSALIFMSLACEDYQDEDYVMTGIDELACQALNDTLVTVVDTAVTAIQPAAQGCFQVKTPVAADTFQVILDSYRSGGLVMYFTDYVKISLADTSVSTELVATDVSLAPEMIAGCTEIVDGKVTPVVKTRVVYEVAASVYRLQIIKTDQTQKHDFKAVIKFQ